MSLGPAVDQQISDPASFMWGIICQPFIIHKAPKICSDTICNRTLWRGGNLTEWHGPEHVTCEPRAGDPLTDPGELKPCQRKQQGLQSCSAEQGCLLYCDLGSPWSNMDFTDWTAMGYQGISNT